VLERHGLGYEDFRAVNPRIIYAVASGYGNEGPERTLPSMDIMAQARSGFMNMNGDPDSPPQAAPAATGDQVGSYFLAHGILAALFMRERTGLGQQIDASLLGGQIDFQSHSLQSYLFTGIQPPRRRRTEGQALWNCYQGSDGRWFVIGLLPQERWWPQLIDVLGVKHWEQDPLFADREARMANMPALIEAFDQHFATRPRDHWVIANGYIVEIDHPVGRRVKMVNHPVRFSAAPEVGVKGPAPEFGQHTEEVLLGAGLTWEEIAALSEQGAIGVPSSRITV
jgi:crotonobetainyl-CoA:carnitine CoA-transferase CaiB-like acyl-CoA transferase